MCKVGIDTFPARLVYFSIDFERRTEALLGCSIFFCRSNLLPQHGQGACERGVLLYIIRALEPPAPFFFLSSLRFIISIEK